jgi:organic radical activating enzyme
MNLSHKDQIDIDFDITRTCNNRCPYCSEFDYLDNALKINEDVFEQVIKAVNEYDRKVFISLLGGDPLVVPEKVREFVLRINAEVNVFSNMSFPPESKHIQLVKDLDCSFTNSWHDTSKHSWVKSNILALKDKVTPILMIREGNQDLMLENSKWLVENNIAYTVQFIRDEFDIVQIQNIMDDRVREMFSNSKKEVVDIIDDQEFNEIQSLDADLLNIATRYKVICQLYSCRIKFDGTINTLCSHPIDYGHIRDGLNFKELMCSGNHCICDTSNYKRIINYANNE